MAGPFLEIKGRCAIFQKKGEKGQNIRKFVQKYTKFENILKKGSLMHVFIICMKQLEYAPHGLQSLSGDLCDRMCTRQHMHISIYEWKIVL